MTSMWTPTNADALYLEGYTHPRQVEALIGEEGKVTAVRGVLTSPAGRAERVELRFPEQRP